MTQRDNSKEEVLQNLEDHLFMTPIQSHQKYGKNITHLTDKLLNPNIPPARASLIILKKQYRTILQIL